MFSHDCETLRGCICSGTSLRYRGHSVLAPGLKTEGAAMSNDDHKPMTEDQARKYRTKASGFRKTSTSMNAGRVSVSRWSRVFLANSTDVSRCCQVNRKVRPSTSKYRWTPSIITNDRLFPAFSGGYRYRNELRHHRFRSLSAHGVRIPRSSDVVPASIPFQTVLQAAQIVRLGRAGAEQWAVRAVMFIYPPPLR